MPDFEQHKIPIIEGINDIPEPPTETEGGNISHMYEQFNILIDSVVTGNQELQEEITYNYNYFYDYCYSNKELINNNATTISGNRTYHDGVTSNLEQQLDAALQRIVLLETEIFGDLSLYFYDDIVLSNGQFVIPILATGQLVEILVDNVTNQFDLFFYSNDFSFTQQFNTSTVEGYGYDYAPDSPVQVTEGNQLTMNNSGNNDPLITKVRLKII